MKGRRAALFSFLVCSFVLVGSFTGNTYAQHTDVFNIDFEKKDRNEVKGKGFIEVEECTTYKVAVEKEKLDNNDFSVHDLELIEIPPEDLSKFAWHIDPVILEEEIVQTQTRTAGNLDCTRSRHGTLYWMGNGKKHVNWGQWSFWKCAKDDKEK